MAQRQPARGISFEALSDREGRRYNDERPSLGVGPRMPLLDGRRVDVAGPFEPSDADPVGLTTFRVDF